LTKNVGRAVDAGPHAAQEILAYARLPGVLGQLPREARGVEVEKVGVTE
jgi:hypothetical protein